MPTSSRHPEGVTLFKLSCSHAVLFTWNVLPSLFFWQIHASLWKLCTNISPRQKSSPSVIAPIRPHQGGACSCRAQKPHSVALCSGEFWPLRTAALETGGSGGDSGHGLHSSLSSVSSRAPPGREQESPPALGSLLCRTAAGKGREVTSQPRCSLGERGPKWSRTPPGTSVPASSACIWTDRQQRVGCHHSWGISHRPPRPGPAGERKEHRSGWWVVERGHRVWALEGGRDQWQARNGRGVCYGTAF